VVEDAVQSCLRVSTNAIHIAKARIIRAKVRLAAGASSSAQEGACFHAANVCDLRAHDQVDLQAALIANPGDADAQHQI
jgi:hypothetical protein